MDPRRDLSTLNSQYVMDVLGLKVGDQNHLMAIRRLRHSDDQVMVAPGAFKVIYGKHFVKNFKYCYDEADDIVYVTAHEARLAGYYCA